MELFCLTLVYNLYYDQIVVTEYMFSPSDQPTDFPSDNPTEEPTPRYVFCIIINTYFILFG